MRLYDNKLFDIIKEGQKTGAFRRDLKPYIFRALLYGTMDDLCTPWAMLQKEHNLASELDDFYELLCKALMTQQQP
jgi:hypothetical protein